MAVSRILAPNGHPFPAPSRNGHASRPTIRAKYDAAQTTVENSNHWAQADSLSARAALDPATRQKLRDRSRYEVANNCYASGIVETIANDVIGTGPRLQLMTGNPDANARTADAFEEWTAAVGLAEKLRTYRESRTVDGEAFALLIANPGLPTAVRLDLRLYEADQVATPDLFLPDPREVDGIRFDRFGNPADYTVLKQHPGDTAYTNWSGWEYDRVPADLVLHWFKKRRAGQVRGLPELTAALPLFAILRRYTLATLSAAEIAALFAAILKSTMPPEEGDAPGLLPFDTQEIVRGMMTSLPDGYDLTQLKAEQPTTTYPGFKDAVINEIARLIQVPFNVAAGNSSSYNYSSGRLDHQVYHRSIGVDRYHLETAILDRVFRVWLREASLVDPGAVDGLDLPPGRITRLPRHQWFWDGFAHVDPEKEANAQATRMLNGTTTLADEWAEAGYDWREKARQQAEERAYYKELGIPYPGEVPPALPAPPAPNGAGNGNPPDDQGD